ncbi:MAG TPA: xanthine dehydrogenase family protein molybdopterin-binding subunit, partial [Syntrophorhabdaceae bacterium]|nr:xanthine dehydrogenase family protein molybdopterin-binding subunit [Syntrophorhabdaceae bacterium]
MANERDYYIESIPIPETPAPGVAPKPWGKTRVVGRAQPKVDAYERLSGKAIYPSDVSLPGMLYGAILRSPHANAVVRKVDVSAASSMEGVRGVLSAASSGVDLLWPYGRSQRFKLFDPNCRYEGEVVAAVAADTPYKAWDAVRAIKVEYDTLPFVADESLALSPNTQKVQPEGNRVRTPERYERGDVAKGFAEADVVLEQTYRTDCQIHTPVETHGCVARWDGNELTVWESTQGVYGVQAQIAEILGLPLSKVRVIGHYMGGGFGAKLQTDKSTIIAALLAKRTRRPVKIFLTREETYLAVGNRPAANMRLKAGIKKNGTLTALEFSILGSGGAYAAGGTGAVDSLVKDLYLCPNVRTEATDVYMNAGPARAFRAPGHPQGAWALEQMMDALSEAIGMDPVEMRLKNIPLKNQSRPGTPPYTSTGLKQCLEEGAKAFRWRETRLEISRSQKNAPVRRGLGMASCLWSVGGGRPPSTIIVKLFSDGSANLNMGASDLGTGTKTVMAMVIAEELGIKPEVIAIEHADTGTTQYATPSGGSKTVPTESPAVRAAAIDVKQQLLKIAAQELETDPASVSLESGFAVSTKNPSKKVLFSDLKGLKDRGVIVGIGYRAPNPEGFAINPFCAQFCEVEVNTETGEVKILRFVS